MAEYIALLRSDYDGVPRVGSPAWHLVRFTTNSHPTPVNQMRAGGQYPSRDCGAADVVSLAADYGIQVSIRTVEAWAGTTQLGTSFGGLQRAFANLRIPSRFVFGTPPGGLVGMNPAFAGVIPPSQMGTYYASARTVNQMLVIDAGAQPVSSSHPIPTTTAIPRGDDDVAVILAKRNDSANDPHGPGAEYLVANFPYGPKRWIADGEVAAYEAITGPVKLVSGVILDRMEEGPPIVSGSYPKEG